MVDELYAVFQYAGSKHTAAGRMAEKFSMLLKEAKEETKAVKQDMAKKLKEVQVGRTKKTI
eukprot:1183596-Prorocentrum_minimum.AAC.1